MEIKGKHKVISLYRAHREGCLYLLFGGLTFCIGIATYAFFNIIVSLNAFVSNVISWSAGVTFAFFTNRKWVFKANSNKKRYFWRQFYMFISVRIITLGIQESLLYILIIWVRFPSLWAKFITEIINIILNYILSKWIVFNVH